VQENFYCPFVNNSLKIDI